MSSIFPKWQTIPLMTIFVIVQSKTEGGKRRCSSLTCISDPESLRWPVCIFKHTRRFVFNLEMFVHPFSMLKSLFHVRKQLFLLGEWMEWHFKVGLFPETLKFSFICGSYHCMYINQLCILIFKKNKHKEVMNEKRPTLWLFTWREMFCTNRWTVCYNEELLVKINCLWMYVCPWW